MKDRQFGIVMLIFTTFFWGSTFVLVKRTVEIVPLDGFLTVRFAIATSLLFFLIVFDKKALAHLRGKQEIIGGIILGTLLYTSFWFQTEGLVLTTPAKAAFITGLNVVLVPILGLMFKNAVNKYEWIASFLALFGLAMMSLNFSNLSVINIGDLMIIVTAICVALHVLYTQKYAQTNTKVLVFYQLLTVTIQSFAISLIRSSFWLPTTDIHPVVLLTLIVTAFFATAFAFVSQTYAQKNGVTSPQVAIIFALEPIFALLIDLSRGIIFGYQILLGMSLTLLAMVLTSMFGASELEK